MTARKFFVGLSAIVLGLTFLVYPICTSNDEGTGAKSVVATIESSTAVGGDGVGEAGGRAAFLDWQDVDAGEVMVCADEDGCPVYSTPPDDLEDSDAN